MTLVTAFDLTHIHCFFIRTTVATFLFYPNIQCIYIRQTPFLCLCESIFAPEMHIRTFFKPT